MPPCPTEHCYVRTCDEPVTTHLRGAAFCDAHARALGSLSPTCYVTIAETKADGVGSDPCEPRVTDEPHSPPPPHVHPPLWHEVATAAGTYLFAAVLLAAASLVLGATCGAGVLGYRLVSEVAR